MSTQKYDKTLYRKTPTEHRQKDIVMRISYSQGHLPLPCFEQVFGICEVLNGQNKRQ